MKFRAVALAITALAVCPLAAADDPVVIGDQHEAAYSAAMETYFALMSETNQGMKVLEAPTVDIIVARIEDDGEVVTACVHDWGAARDFMNRRHRIESNTGEEK